MKRLRVAIYHATLPGLAGRKGGVEAAVHRLGNALARRGNIEPVVYSSGSPPGDAIYEHRRVLDRSNRRRLSRIFLSPVLLNFVNFSDVDVIHLHGDDWFMVNRRRPTVRSMLGSALQEAHNARRWPRKVLMFVVYWLEHLSVRLATETIAIGPETGQIYNINRVIGMSVDRTVYRPCPKTVEPTVVFIGGWETRKRGDFAFRIFVDKVLPRMRNAKMIMVTDFDPGHPAVTVRRDLSDEALAAVLGSAWVFAYPSTYEGFGIPYIEAMSCGTAVVASPNPGADYVLDNGRFGRIVADDGFGEAVLALMRDAEARETMEASGARRAAEFDEDEITASIESVYHVASTRARGEATSFLQTDQRFGYRDKND